MTRDLGPGALAGFALFCLSLVSAAPPAWGQASRSGPVLNACAGKPESGYWIERLTAPDPRTRSLAASALGEMRAKTAVRALIRALDDGDARVRRAAVDALGRIGPDAKAAVPALTRVLSDDDAAIRATAQRTLDRIGGRR